MWWDWAESLEIYLCRGVAWCCVPGQGLLQVRMPATLPLPGQLQRIGASLAIKRGAASRLRVYLGARICPPVCFSVPDGLRWDEMGWLARKHAATVWGLGPAETEQLTCEQSTHVAGLAAGLPVSTVRTIEAFAREQGCRLVALAPMWAECVPEMRGKMSAEGRAVMKEPDGTVLSLRAHSAGCESAFLEEMPVAKTGPAQTWRWNVVEQVGTTRHERTDRIRLVECFDRAAQ